METRPGPVCWLSDLVEVRPSSIAGVGLFAAGDIGGGVVVSRLGGRIVNGRELRSLMDAAGESYVDAVSVFEDAHLVLPPGTPNHHGNHSCDPNLWWVDPFALATRSPVAAGEELTVDYGTLTDDAGFRMTCACGAGCCRGEVTGEDWARVELQERYGAHWVPVLRARIRDAATS